MIVRKVQSIALILVTTALIILTIAFIIHMFIGH